MNSLTRTFKGKSPLEAAKTVLSSKYFPFVNAALFLAFYYLGWDIVTIYFVGIIGTAMVLLLDDLTPLIPQYLFMDVMISYKNSPSEVAGDAGYFTSPVIYGQIIFIIAVYVIAVLTRIFFLTKGKKFRPTPVFYGLCFLCACFLLNGVGSVNYTVNDFAYGVFMTFFFLAFYVLISGNVNLTEENFRKIAWGFLAFSVLLILELGIKYLTNWKGMFTDGGEIEKEAMVFGWGIWNTMGMLLSICIPPMFLLASKYKHGYLFILYATVIMLAAFVTASREAILGAGIAFVSCSVAVVIKTKGRRRLLNSVTIGAVLLIGLIVVGAKWQAIARLWAGFGENMFDDEGLSFNGRVNLWTLAVKHFASNPFFGAGFFAGYDSYNYVGLGIIPTFPHNTYATMLAACGFFGVIAYALHRVQTLIAFVQSPDFNKLMIGISISVMLILSLFDNHIFYILPTMIYSGLLPFATGTGGVKCVALIKEFRKAEV